MWGVAIAVVALAVTWGLWPRAIEVDLAAVDRGDVRVELVDEGRTRMHDVYVISAPVSGRVLRVDVEPGDHVAAGSVRNCDRLKPNWIWRGANTSAPSSSPPRNWWRRPPSTAVRHVCRPRRRPAMRPTRS
jgi:hypothetical protein